MKPRAAGEYGIVRDAYGRPLGFIYGWTQFLIARTASAAALAVGFAIFLNDLVGGALKHAYLDHTHFRAGSRVSLGRLQLVALWRDHHHHTDQLRGGASEWRRRQRAHWHEDGSADWCRFWRVLLQRWRLGQSRSWQIPAERVKAWRSSTGGIAGFAAAMIGALWAYDGWNNITFLAGEVKNPGRNLPLALIGGGFVVMGLYLFVNVSYFHVLTPTEIASVSRHLRQSPRKW